MYAGGFLLKTGIDQKLNHPTTYMEEQIPHKSRISMLIESKQRKTKTKTSYIPYLIKGFHYSFQKCDFL